MEKKIIIFTLLFISVIASANALSINDVSFDRNYYYPDESIVAEITVSNTGSASKFANIRVVASDAIIWHDAKSFLIGPDSTVTRAVLLRAPDVEEPKEVDFEFKVYSSAGSLLDSTTEKTIVLIPDYTFETGIIPVSASVLPDEEAVVELKITNLGHFNEIYTITVDGWERAEYAIEKTKVPVSLNSYASTIITFNPKYSEPGQHTVIIETCSLYGDCKTNDFVIDVLEQSNSIIVGGEPISIQKGTASKFEIDVYNEGNVERNYEFVYDKALNEIITINPSSFALNPGEGRSIEVTIDSSEYFEEGTYDFELKLINEDEEINNNLMFQITGGVVGIPGDFSGLWIVLIFGLGIGGYMFWRYQIFQKKKKYEYWK